MITDSPHFPTRELTRYKTVRINPPLVKTPEPNIYKNFQKNKTLGAKRPKFGVDLGAKRPKKSGFLAFLKGESSKRGSEIF